MRGNLLRTTAFVVVSGILFTAAPARAELPTIDAITHILLGLLQNAVTQAISKAEDAVKQIGKDIVNEVSTLDTDLSDLLTKGFTQQSNYQKAVVKAQMQIADGQNAAMARINRDTRNAQIVSEHTVSPQQCLAASNGQGNVAASVAAAQVAQSIGSVTDNRGEAVNGQPAFHGQAQAVMAFNMQHMDRYCSETESDAGLCTMTALANADQHAWNLFGTGNYGDQDGVNAANDFATTLLQPVPPAALRADQLTSLTGQDAFVRRRSYNARMSLGRNLLNYIIGIQAPVVPLTASQKQQLTNEGLPATAKGSWLQALTLEVDRRFSDLGWAAALQAMAPATVQREIATELALGNYLALQNYRVGLWQAALTATQVAQAEEVNFQTAAPMPTPTVN